MSQRAAAIKADDNDAPRERSRRRIIYMSRRTWVLRLMPMPGVTMPVK